ncbi:MAG TPA: T9SS type A sorting domain-containing protein, partial [Patescibacteria group bacterium]|nr:T9SS type A sorting domain-containing protein [Patescibacteria group bacterium]
FSLNNVYPNPTTSNAEFTFEVPSVQVVRLTVANALGQTIAIPFEGTAQPGLTSVPFNASSLSNGMYFYTLHIEGKKLVRSFVVAK